MPHEIPSGAPAPEPASPASPEQTLQDAAVASSRPRLMRATLAFVLAVSVCVLAYLAWTLPGAWFPSASPLRWPASQLTLSRGTGQVAAGELVLAPQDATGVAVVSVVTNLRSTDYPAIEWVAIGFPEDADVRLLWRTSYAPERLNSTPIGITSGRTLPVILAHNPQWIGSITGVALAIRGPLPQAIRIRGAIAKPMGAREVLQDRIGEWFAFESWNGASINTLTGGAEVQDLPLPLLLACAIVLASLGVAAAARWKPGTFGVAVPALVAVFFIAGWTLLDLRWAGNLIRQERATAGQYGGKSLREKHLASEDGPLFAFIERARDVLPATPARVFIAADTDYFRLRAAYHLYPHSAFGPPNNTLPHARDLRPGDWLLVYQRRGMQYDVARHMLRWDDQTASADVKLVEPGAALFLIR